MDAAERIRQRYPHVPATELVGKAYDTLFRSMCAEDTLRTRENQQVIAPFSFVSMLAGAALALLFISTQLGARPRFNYWRLSPWRSPNPDLRQYRLRDPSCELCSRGEYQELVHGLWAQVDEHASAAA